MFIRSIMEYQSTAWMSAAQSHLDKLDRIQHRAEMIGSFTVGPLQAEDDYDSHHGGVKKTPRSYI